MLQLYREKYFDFKIQHFHEKLKSEHGISQSYTWVKTAVQEAGLVERTKKRGTHRRRRPGRPMPGMMLHIDASEHDWFGDGRKYELIVILDDATSEIYYAQLVEAESTRSILGALWEVVKTRGLFCSPYSDLAGHFFVTPRAGEKVDKTRLTQMGRALDELGIKMIPAYSPQARGRSERSSGTWQRRLPQELRLRGAGASGRKRDDSLRSAPDCGIRSGSAAGAGTQEARDTEDSLIRRRHERKNRPAAARNLDRPLCRFPYRGQAGAPPPPLRCGSGKVPAQSRTLHAFRAGKESVRLDGAPPRNPSVDFVWQSGRFTC